MMLPTNLSIQLAVISTVFILATAAGVQATTVTVGSIDYETVDWVSVDTANNNATGTAGGNSVDLSANSIPVNSITSIGHTPTYSNDPGFTGPIYSGGTIDSIFIEGATGGTNTLTFGNSVSSILLFLGRPPSTLPGNSFNTSVWDFPDSPFNVSVINETGSGIADLDVNNDNILSNAGSDARGIVLVENTTPFKTLTWTQADPTGEDQLFFTVAVGPEAAVPSPSAMLLMGTGLIGLLGWKLRRT